MKSLFFLVPLLLVGCFRATFVEPQKCNTVAITHSATAKVSYTCEQLDCNAQNITFRCEFHNETSDLQPGPAIKIALFSEQTNQKVLSSRPIYAFPVQPNGTDVRYMRWARAEVAAACGFDLERCVVLIEKVWPKK
jgi:hypothetical protein